MKGDQMVQLLLATVLVCACEGCGNKPQSDGALYKYTSALRPRWSSPENLNGHPGSGGRENGGAKGRPFGRIPAGKSLELLNVTGTGIINRIWITVQHRDPEMLRSLTLEIFWDESVEPAVAVPFGDFFGVGLGRTAKFDSHLFINAEGRSFLCLVPMPFRSGARIVVTNESSRNLDHIYWDIDFQQIDFWEPDNLYFHSSWHRDTATTPGKDFELLRQVKGKGRFLGVNIGVNANPVYGSSWWGEGEVKMYLDADTDYPTLVGTGTEDYIGTAWEQGLYSNAYSGCLIADSERRQWAFYRYHIVDPIYFQSACRITLQQIGGGRTSLVAEMQKNNVPLIPVCIDVGGKLTHLYREGAVTDLSKLEVLEGGTIYYRSDDVSATAYFYLDRPVSGLPPLQAVALRTYNLKASDK